MGRADPGTVISELLSVQKLVAPLAGSVNRCRRSEFDCLACDANASNPKTHFRGQVDCKARRGLDKR